MGINKAAISKPMPIVTKVSAEPSPPSPHSHIPRRGGVRTIPPPQFDPSQSEEILAVRFQRRPKLPPQLSLSLEPEPPSIPPVLPPKDFPRPRRHSDAAQQLLSLSTLRSPRSVIDNLETRESAAIGVECSAALVNDAVQVYSDFTNLLKACKECRTETFHRFSGIFIMTTGNCLRKLQVFPHFVREAPVVKSSRASLDFSIQVLRNFIDSLPRDISDEAKKETSTNLASLAVMVWDNLTALMRISYQEELYHSLSKKLEEPPFRGGESPSSESGCGTDTDSQEVAKVVALLDRPLLEVSSEALKTLKEAISDHFRAISFPKPTIRFKRLPPQEANGNATRGVTTRPAVDSFILVDNATSSSAFLATQHNRGKSLDTGKEIARQLNVRETKLVLRDSVIFFSAAATTVNSLDRGFDTKVYYSLWQKVILRSDLIRSKIRHPTASGRVDFVHAATFPALVHLVILNSEEPDYAELVDTMFLFFRDLRTPGRLFDIIRTVYNQDSPARGTLSSEACSPYRRYTRLRAVRLLAIWLKLHWEESTDNVARWEIEHFAKTVISVDPSFTPALAANLVTGITSLLIPPKREEEVKPDRQLYPPTAFEPQMKHMLDMVSQGRKIALVDAVMFAEEGGAEELARGLTVFESEFFHSFIPRDLGNIRFGREPRKFREWENMSTAMFWWVVSSVISHKTPDKRVQVYELFIDVAYRCKEMKNFNSAQAITNALKEEALVRLSTIMTLVSREHHLRLGELVRFFQGIVGYRREMMKDQPAIPIPFMIRHDIGRVSMECIDYSHHTTSTGENLIGLDYYQGIRRTIRDLERIRKKMPLPHNTLIIHWIAGVCEPFIGLPFEDVRMNIMKKSISIEPFKPKINLPPLIPWASEDYRERIRYNAAFP